MGQRVQLARPPTPAPLYEHRDADEELGAPDRKQLANLDRCLVTSAVRGGGAALRLIGI